MVLFTFTNEHECDTWACSQTKLEMFWTRQIYYSSNITPWLCYDYTYGDI